MPSDSRPNFLGLVSNILSGTLATFQAADSPPTQPIKFCNITSFSCHVLVCTHNGLMHARLPHPSCSRVGSQREAPCISETYLSMHLCVTVLCVHISSCLTSVNNLILFSYSVDFIILLASHFCFMTLYQLLIYSTGATKLLANVTDKARVRYHY